MEILYYWIDKYDKIIRQGFNFGGELLFEYEGSVKKLIVKKNNDYIKDFFHYEEDDNLNAIKNISAIVGGNGSGKTTFLNALKGLTIDGGILATRDENGKVDLLKRIFVYKSKSTIKIIFHKDLILKNEDGKYNIEFNGLEEFKIELIGYDQDENVDEYNNHHIRVKGSDILANTACIYFSNLFDSNLLYYPTMIERQYFDISTRGMMEQTGKYNRDNLNTITLKNPNYFNHKDEKFGIGTLKNYCLNELKLKLRFLRDSNLRKKIPFTIPESISLSLDYILCRNEHFDFLDINEQAFLRNEKDMNSLNKIERYTYEYIRKNAVEISHDSQRISDRDLAKKTFLLRIADAFFEDIDKFIFFNTDKELVRDNINKIEDAELDGKNICDIFEICKTITINSLIMAAKNDNDGKMHKNFDENNFIKLVNSYSIFIKNIISLFDNKNIEFYRGSVMGRRKNGAATSVISEEICLPNIKLDDEGIELVNQLLDNYSNIFTASDFVKFVWQNISTGEDALLSMYSRFYNVKNQISCDNLLIILDEGELYFHPEWQRKFIHMIIEYLPRVFSKCKTIQVVASSNSPFLIADLPKNNVMFLGKYDREEQQLVITDEYKVVDGISAAQTFAANIHNLLMENFFLSTTIGEFAHRKIRRIIKVIKSPKGEEIPRYKIEDIRRNINIIGETIIRKRLQEMFVNRFEYEERNFYEEKINQLLQEISKLKSIRNKNEFEDLDDLLAELKEKIDHLKKKVDSND